MSFTLAPITNMRRFDDSFRALFLAKRLIDRWALIGEELRTVLGNVQTVFQTNSELAVDDNCGLVAKAHAGLDRRFVPAHEVRPLMAVETYAMAGAVRQTGSLVIRTKARIGDHLARLVKRWTPRRAR